MITWICAAERLISLWSSSRPSSKRMTRRYVTANLLYLQINETEFMYFIIAPSSTFSLVNLRNRTGEERRRKNLCDKRDKQLFPKLHIPFNRSFCKRLENNSLVTSVTHKRFAVLFFLPSIGSTSFFLTNSVPLSFDIPESCKCEFCAVWGRIY